MSFLVDDDDELEDEFEEVIELPHTPSVLERRICDLEDNFAELLRAVADVLETVQQAEDELREIVENFDSPAEE